MEIMSESVINIFTALADAQSKTENVIADTKGYGYSYAELGSYLNQAKDILKENGLAFCSFFQRDQNNAPIIVTLFTHTSGEWIRSEFPIEIDKEKTDKKINQMQAIGSVFTYVRRYNFRGMLNMHDCDDDGKTAEDLKFKERRAETANKPQLPDYVGQLKQKCAAQNIIVKDFCGFHKVTALDPTTVKNALDNFDDLVAKFMEGRKNAE